MFSVREGMVWLLSNQIFRVYAFCIESSCDKKVLQIWFFSREMCNFVRKEISFSPFLLFTQLRTYKTKIDNGEKTNHL